MDWNSVLDPTRNEVTAGSVGPSDGSSIAGAATGSNVQRSVTQTGGGQAAAANAPTLPAGDFVTGMIVFAVLTAITMFVVHKWGGDDSNFGNIRASAYNILIISLIAAVGLPVIKIGFLKLADLHVPLADHASTWVIAA